MAPIIFVHMPIAIAHKSSNQPHKFATTDSRLDAKQEPIQLSRVTTYASAVKIYNTVSK
jgi:hypothetical protein